MGARRSMLAVSFPSCEMILPSFAWKQSVNQVDHNIHKGDQATEEIS